MSAQVFEIPDVIISIAIEYNSLYSKIPLIFMSEIKNGIISIFKTLLKAIFGALVIIFVIFCISATVSSLLGYSLWSWMNVLRFYLGTAIVLILGLCGVVIKGMLFGKTGKKRY